MLQVLSSFMILKHVNAKPGNMFFYEMSLLV